MNNLPPNFSQDYGIALGMGECDTTISRPVTRPAFVPVKNHITWEQMCRNSEIAEENGIINEWED